jgi:hypothetical protein
LIKLLKGKMMNHTVSDDAFAGPKATLNPGQSITLTLQQASKAFLGVENVVISARTWRFAEHLAPVVAKGGTITIPATVIKDVTSGLGQKPPPVQAMGEPISTTVVVVVLVLAAVAGFALGYGLSDAADSEGDGTITVTNEGGNVEVNVGDHGK